VIFIVNSDKRLVNKQFNQSILIVIISRMDPYHAVSLKQMNARTMLLKYSHLNNAFKVFSLTNSLPISPHARSKEWHVLLKYNRNILKDSNAYLVNE